MKNSSENNGKNIGKSIAAFCLRLAVCAALILVFALCARFLPNAVTYEYTPKQQEASSTAGAAAEPSENIGILRETDGKIGVFRSDGSLIRTIDADPNRLTAYDRTLLSGGISVPLDELCELIEALKS